MGTADVAAAWTAPERVSTGRDARLSALHEVAAGGGVLHAVHGRTGGGATDDRVYYQRSGNGGRSWSRERVLWAPGPAYRGLTPNLAIAAWHDIVVVAFRVHGPRGSALFVRVSRNRGATFDDKIGVAASGSGRGLGVPAVAIARGAVFVAWTHRSSSSIRVRRSTNGGRSFGSATTLGTSHLSISCGSSRPVDGLVGLAAAGRTVHVAWSQARPGECIARSAWIRTSVDRGGQWRPARQITSTPSFGWPELTAFGTRIAVSLQRPNGTLLVATSRNSGGSFGQRSFTAPSGWEVGAGDVTLMDGNRLWVVFPSLRYRGNEILASRLRFAASPDAGRSWQRSVTILPEASRLRHVPNLVALSNRPVVVYQGGPANESRAAIWSMRRS
jgi:hypothetical protein